MPRKLSVSLSRARRCIGSCLMQRRGTGPAKHPIRPNPNASSSRYLDTLGRPPAHYFGSRATIPEGPMKRLLRIAAVAHLLLSSGFSDAYAADPYDGNWTGSATSTGGRCRPARVTLSVEGRVVRGQARFEGDAPNIHGTVLQDGALGATIGFQHLTGKFTQDEFEGTFKSSDCVWKMLLKRTK
jgi:hypothetical protein